MGDPQSTERAQVLLVTPSEVLAQRIAGDLGPLLATQWLGTTEGARKAITAFRWRGVVVDLALPERSGLDLAEYARMAQPEAELLVLADALDAAEANRAASLGAFMATKPVEPAVIRDFLRRCWRQATSGTSRSATEVPNPGAPEVSRWARRQVVRREAERCGLTPREAEILTLLVEGRPWQDVADGLGISRRTYATHVSRILRKTGADGIGSLVIALLLLAQNEGIRAARLTGGG